MEYAVFLGAVVAFYLIVVIQGKINERSVRKHFIARLKKEYGHLNEAEYSNERMMAVKGMYEWHEGESFTVDDITWNDIDGDRLYKNINHCYSSAGDEYLYYRMRTPLLEDDAEEFRKNEAIYAYLDANEEERIRFQLLFATMGRTGKFSLYRYLEYLCELPMKKAVSFIWPWILLVFGIVMLFVNVYVGLAVLLTVIVY